MNIEKIIAYLDEYIKDRESVGGFENECYITAAQDFKNFIQRK
jgi:hypothetical protein